jgi:prevent-host-death family protein
MRTATIETARATLGDLVARAQMTGESTLITRYGKPAAVLVPISLSPEPLDEAAVEAPR